MMHSGPGRVPANNERTACPRSSVVEHFLGKEGVTSSILVVGFLSLGEGVSDEEK